jgi:hypothetical protein
MFKRVLPIAFAAVVLLLPSAAQAETFEQFGSRISKTTSKMMVNHRHTAAERDWASSDYNLLTEDVEYLKDALARADKQCDVYASKKLWWSPIAYNRVTNSLLAESLSGLPTFAPTPAQSKKIHLATLIVATQYEAEKVQCPDIVWTNR